MLCIWAKPFTGSRNILIIDRSTQSKAIYIYSDHRQEYQKVTHWSKTMHAHILIVGRSARNWHFEPRQCAHIFSSEAEVPESDTLIWGNTHTYSDHRLKCQNVTLWSEAIHAYILILGRSARKWNFDMRQCIHIF